MFYKCSNAGMQIESPSTIAQVLLSAPGWARVALSAPTERLREKAAQELALSILETLDPQRPDHDPRQLPLSL